MRLHEYFYCVVLSTFLLATTSCLDGASPSPVFKKCCPANEAFSFGQRKCVPFPSSALQQFPGTIQPAFASQAQAGHVQYDEEEEINTVFSPDFQLSNDTAMPKCDEERQELHELLSPDNEASMSDFLIDDQNLTNRAYSLIDLGEAEQYMDFCLDSLRRDDGQFVGTVALFCATRREVVCRERPCVSFCCQQGYFYDSGTRRCEVDPTTAFPSLKWVSADGSGRSVKVNNTVVKFFFENSPVSCAQHHLYDEFDLLENGLLDAGGDRLNYTSYCLERHGDYNGSFDGSRALNATLKALVCAPTDPFSNGYLEYIKIVDLTLVPALFVVSLVFLALLFAFVYVRNRHKLFGVMTLCLVAMLFLFYLFLLVTKFSGAALVTDFPVTCVAIGLCVQYCYMSAMFWLNAMSFDIWSTFRRMRRMPEPSGVGGGARQGWKHKRFKFYAAYAWACPMVIVLVTILVQFLPAELTEDLWTPMIGETRCFLESTWAMVFYLYIVIGPLLCVNIVFFLSSMWNLLCGVWADKSGDPVLRAQNKTKYKTVVKLFFAMGITWLAEVISFAVEWSYGPKRFRYFITAVNIVNSLQGLILFVVIVFDAATIAKIRQCFMGKDAALRMQQQRHRRSEPSSGGTETSTTTSPMRKLSNLWPEKLRKKSSANLQSIRMINMQRSPSPPREI